ncbi:MAG: RAMP superfamily CRISPR-associated protein [Microgenomates group bacterium]
MKTVKKICLKTITPIHISSGEDFDDYNFFFYQDSIYIVDIDKVLKSRLSGQLKLMIDDFLKKNDKNDRFAIDNFIKKLRILYNNNFQTLNNCGLIEDKILLKHTSAEQRERMRTEKIKKFIRYLDIEDNKEKIFIPGSSIKGAFVEVFVNYIRQKKEFINENEIRKSIGFSDFYFEKSNSWIQKITRIGKRQEENNRKERGVKIWAELVEGEAIGDIYFEDNQKISNLINNIFLEGSTIIKSKTRFNAPYSDNFSDLKNRLEEYEDLIILLGFGSGSFENTNKTPKTYFSYDDKNPLGVVSLSLEK